MADAGEVSAEDGGVVIAEVVVVVVVVIAEVTGIVQAVVT